jgi:hypothetical protein
MPKMLKVGPNPNFNPKDPDQKAAFAKIKVERPRLLAYVTAMENIRLSGGMYSIISDDVEPAPAAARTLEDHSIEELKVMMLQVGVKPMKQMTKAGIIASIRKALDAVDVVADEETDAE